MSQFSGRFLVTEARDQASAILGRPTTDNLSPALARWKYPVRFAHRVRRIPGFTPRVYKAVKREVRGAGSSADGLPRTRLRPRLHFPRGPEGSRTDHSQTQHLDQSLVHSTPHHMGRCGHKRFEDTTQSRSQSESQLAPHYWGPRFRGSLPSSTGSPPRNARSTARTRSARRVIPASARRAHPSRK